MKGAGWMVKEPSGMMMEDSHTQKGRMGGGEEDKADREQEEEEEQGRCHMAEE